MRAEVILHEKCRPSFRAWHAAMLRRCEGEAVSADMLFTELLKQLRVSAGKPAGAESAGPKSGNDEIWVWNYYPDTTVHYLVRDRRNLLGFTSRRVVLLRIQPRLPGGSRPGPIH